MCGYFKSLRHEVIGCGISVSILALGPIDKLIPVNVTRQADLCLVAVANSLTDSWICGYPWLTFMYLQHYFPDMCSRLIGWLGPRIAAKMKSKYGATDTP